MHKNTTANPKTHPPGNPCFCADEAPTDAHLLCGHQFHAGCLRKHANVLNTRCPFCNDVFTEMRFKDGREAERVQPLQQATAAHYADDGRPEHEDCLYCGNEQLRCNGLAIQLICDGGCNRVAHAHCAGFGIPLDGITLEPMPPEEESWHCRNCELPPQRPASRGRGTKRSRS